MLWPPNTRRFTAQPEHVTLWYLSLPLGASSGYVLNPSGHVVGVIGSDAGLLWLHIKQQFYRNILLASLSATRKPIYNLYKELLGHMI